MRSRFILVKEGPQIRLNLLGGEGRRLAYWKAGSGDDRHHRRRQMASDARACPAGRAAAHVFAMTADAGTPQEAAREIGAAVAELASRIWT